MKTLTLLTAIILAVCTATAQIINIPTDYPTIQEGIDAAINGDTVLVDTGTYVENINFNGKNITVASLYLTTLDTSYISQTIIDGDSAGSVVRFSNSEDSTAILTGFTLTNGRGGSFHQWRWGGGITVKGSSPSLKQLMIKNNTAPYGGGIYCDSSAVSFEQVSIINNSATGINMSSGTGGGICCTNNSILTLKNMKIANNQGELGGGIHCAENSLLSLQNVTITNNLAELGGGIYCTDNSSLVFDYSNRCNIYFNSGKLGRDLYSDDFIEVVVDTFSVMFPTQYYVEPLENFSFDVNYGKIQQVDADLFVSTGGDNSNSGLSEEEPLKNIDYAGSVIRADSMHHHTIHLMEGIYSPSSNDEIFPVRIYNYCNLDGVSADSVILDAEEQSGVMVLYRNTSSIISKMIIKNGLTNNPLNGSWGGVYAYKSSAILQNMKIEDNKASGSPFGPGHGGGIYLKESNLTLLNMIISNNRALNGIWSGGPPPGGQGGGIYCVKSIPVLQNVSITNNSAKYGDGIYCADSSNLTLLNTIIWNDSDREIWFNENGDSNVINISWSDIQGGMDGIVTNGNGTVNWMEGNIDEDPMFADTGAFPYALQNFSPCVNAGTPDTTGLNLPEFDLAGNPRLFGGRIDMGAFENQIIYVGTEKPEAENSKFEIWNYPNPFTTSTTIEYELEHPATVQINIYNHLGKQIEMIEKCQMQGLQKVVWYPKNLPNGIYYIKLRAGEQVASGKMVVVR